MGENIGVVGAEETILMVLNATAAAAVEASLSNGAGNASHVEVTRSVFSIARRYLPI